MLGALYDTSTYLHVAECLLWRKMLACLPISAAEQARLTAAELRAKHAPFPAIDRPAMGGWWEAQGRRQLGSVGDAECRLCGIRDFADACIWARCLPTRGRTCAPGARGMCMGNGCMLQGVCGERRGKMCRVGPVRQWPCCAGWLRRWPSCEIHSAMNKAPCSCLCLVFEVWCAGCNIDLIDPTPIGFMQGAGVKQ